MDPNETRQQMVNLTKHWRNGLLTAEEYAESMSELWEALDEWLSKGGFFPAKWMLGRSFEQRTTLKACETCGTWHSRCP